MASPPLPAAKRPPRPPSAPSIPALAAAAAAAATPLLPQPPPRPPRPLAAAVAGSTSLFHLPSALSSASLRPRLGLGAPPPGSARVDWVSLAVVYWITLVSEAARGLMLPSTWPYLRSVGGGKEDLGLFVASFSAGRMATTVPLGYLSDNFSTATVLSCASLVQVAGHLAYAVAPSVSTLVLSRVVVGFGSATMSVCRAHLTRAVAPSLRTHHFAYLSALQFVGFAVLPGAGGLLAALPELRIAPGVALNGYTYPAYVLAFCNLLSVAWTYMLYFDPPASTPDAPPSPESPLLAGRPAGYDSTAVTIPAPPAAAAAAAAAAASDTSDDSDDAAPLPDASALIVCLLVNITFRGVVAELETVATPFLMERYGLDYGTSSYYISLVGVLGLGVYLSFKPLARTFADRDLVLAGLFFVLVGALPLGYTPVASRLALGGYVAAIGVLWSLAYPVGQTAILSLFSKVLAGLPAGGFLGLFSASGSLARVLFALFAGKVWGEFGRDAVFATVLGYVALATILVVSNYNRLVAPTAR